MAAPGLREVAGNTMAFSHLVFLLNIFQIVWAVWSRNSAAQSVWPASWRESLIDSFRPTLAMSLACSCCSECIFKAFPCYLLPLNPKSCLRLALLLTICPLVKGRKGMFTATCYIYVCVQFPQLMRSVFFIFMEILCCFSKLYSSPELACLGFSDMHSVLNICLTCTFISV